MTGKLPFSLITSALSTLFSRLPLPPPTPLPPAPDFPHSNRDLSFQRKRLDRRGRATVSRSSAAADRVRVCRRSVGTRTHVRQRPRDSWRQRQRTHGAQRRQAVQRVHQRAHTVGGGAPALPIGQCRGRDPSTAWHCCSEPPTLYGVSHIARAAGFVVSGMVYCMRHLACCTLLCVVCAPIGVDRPSSQLSVHFLTQCARLSGGAQRRLAVEVLHLGRKPGPAEANAQAAPNDSCNAEGMG
jgi:hypothetical protein